MGGQAVLLVGHGVSASDTPAEWRREYRALVRARVERGETPSARERELEAAIRDWPRTAENDPYQAGLNAVAATLAERIAPCRVAVAYNELCAPTIERALDDLCAAGAIEITVVSIMVTPGGHHAEIEIPRALAALRARHPAAQIRYAWPPDLELLTSYLAHVIAGARSEP